MIIKLSCKREKQKKKIKLPAKKDQVMKEKQIIIRGLLLSFCLVLF